MTTATYFAFDTETSGFEPSEGAEILSYAYIVLDENLQEIKRNQRFFFPKGEVPESASAVNGYSFESWTAKGALPAVSLPVHIQYDLEHDVLPNKCIPLGHNVQFDLRFFQKYAPRATMRSALDYHGADTMMLAIALDQAFGQRGSYKLVELCKRFEVPLVGAHDSMQDVAATVELYRRLVGRIRTGAGMPEAPTPPPRQDGFLQKTGSAYTLAKGKYAGKTLDEVGSTDRGYLAWALNTVQLSPEERTAMKAACGL